MKAAFDEVKPGMDKDQVLEVIGGPRAVTRFHGKDRWFMMFYHDGVRYEREIHFTNGLVTYVGLPWEPPVEKQAVTVDRKNYEAEVKTHQELVQTRGDSDKAQEEYEKRIKGEDKVRYVPTFEPVQ